jgi:hypothetical protein
MFHDAYREGPQRMPYGFFEGNEGPKRFAHERGMKHPATPLLLANHFLLGTQRLLIMVTSVDADAVWVTRT